MSKNKNLFKLLLIIECSNRNLYIYIILLKETLYTIENDINKNKLQLYQYILIIFYCHNLFNINLMNIINQ